MLKSLNISDIFFPGEQQGNATHDICTVVVGKWLFTQIFRNVILSCRQFDTESNRRHLCCSIVIVKTQRKIRGKHIEKSYHTAKKCSLVTAKVLKTSKKLLQLTAGWNRCDDWYLVHCEPLNHYVCMVSPTWKQTTHARVDSYICWYNTHEYVFNWNYIVDVA